jgi:hypothetical protein
MRATLVYTYIGRGGIEFNRKPLFTNNNTLKVRLNDKAVLNSVKHKV